MTRDAIDFRGLDQLSPFRFAPVCIDSLGRLTAARASRLPPDDAGSEGSCFDALGWEFTAQRKSYLKTKSHRLAKRTLFPLHPRRSRDVGVGESRSC